MISCTLCIFPQVFVKSFCPLQCISEKVRQVRTTEEINTVESWQGHGCKSKEIERV